ncbi:cysteine hydrolase family protein [Nocardia brasiliensis]|uniref:cysteine hydrolase family protein n=1 Tax=Nocardia brasiliensis TaxID=37326 RepID=UPI002457EBE9|nr:cysteine hydrolase [Nocardia brasiliensis]
MSMHSRHDATYRSIVSSSPGVNSVHQTVTPQVAGNGSIDPLRGDPTESGCATPVLIVVDLQNGFVNEASAHIVPVVVDLVDRWLAVGAEVIFTRFRNHHGSQFQRLLDWNHLFDETDTALIPELEPYIEHPRTQVLDKTTYTALTPEAITHIRRIATTNVAIAGIATNACVLKTALDVFEVGLTPWIIADACASCSRHRPAGEVHESALTLLGRLIGTRQLIDAERALAMVPAVPATPAHLTSARVAPRPRALSTSAS